MLSRWCRHLLIFAEITRSANTAAAAPSSEYLFSNLNKARQTLGLNRNGLYLMNTGKLGAGLASCTGAVIAIAALIELTDLATW
jgi:hypothetical protein